MWVELESAVDIQPLNIHSIRCWLLVSSPWDQQLFNRTSNSLPECLLVKMTNKCKNTIEAASPRNGLPWWILNVCILKINSGSFVHRISLKKSEPNKPLLTNSNIPWKVICVALPPCFQTGCECVYYSLYVCIVEIQYLYSAILSLRILAFGSKVIHGKVLIDSQTFDSVQPWFGQF